MDVAAIFDSQKYSTLPIWAQALLASRITKRCVVELPKTVPQATYDILIAGCEAIDRACEYGARSAGPLDVIEKAARHQPNIYAHAASVAFYFAADCAHAAESSLDFGAAETACANSLQKALTSAADSPGMSALRITIFANGDFDQLVFTCKEFRIGRYDALTSEVMQRLAPVWPPKERPEAAEEKPDPTGGAR